MPNIMGLLTIKLIRLCYQIWAYKCEKVINVKMRVWPWQCKRLRGVDKPKNILEAYTTMINVTRLTCEGYVYMYFYC